MLELVCLQLRDGRKLTGYLSLVMAGVVLVGEKTDNNYAGSQDGKEQAYLEHGARGRFGLQAGQPDRGQGKGEQTAPQKEEGHAGQGRGRNVVAAVEQWRPEHIGDGEDETASGQKPGQPAGQPGQPGPVCRRGEKRAGSEQKTEGRGRRHMADNHFSGGMNDGQAGVFRLQIYTLAGENEEQQGGCRPGRVDDPACPRFPAVRREGAEAERHGVEHKQQGGARRHRDGAGAEAGKKR